MNNLTDQQLLRDYAKGRSEPAFAELVKRHIDFVYSAALRMVRDQHLAEDVAQAVFVVVSQNASQLADHPVLAGWLHRTTQNLAAKTVRTEVRRRNREQESVAMNDLLATESDAPWEQIAPQLDAALGELSETDRDALLLRYFQRKSAREISGILATSEEAAQKRVNRAVERLREIFIKRGITIGTGSLVVAISANAVQAAPVGLTAAITTATSIASATIASTTTATATQTVAMTTLQKTLIATALAAAVGVGIYESRQSSNFRSQLQVAQQQQHSLSEQIASLTQERDDAMHRLASIGNGNQSSNQNSAELLKLRAEVTRLRNEQDRLAELLNDDSNLSANPVEMRAKLWMDKVRRLKEKLEQNPGKSIPEMKYLSDQDWLEVVKDAHLLTDGQYNEALAELRKRAKDKFAPRLSRALRNYARANNNELPPDIAALKPYFANPVEDAMLERYQLLHTGPVKWDEWVVAEKAPADDKYDTMFKVGPSGLQFSTISGMGESGSKRWDTSDSPSLSDQAKYEGVGTDHSDEELDSFTKSYMKEQADARDFKILDRAFKAFSAANPGAEHKSGSAKDLIPYLQTTAEKDAFDRLNKRNDVKQTQ